MPCSISIYIRISICTNIGVNIVITINSINITLLIFLTQMKSESGSRDAKRAPSNSSAATQKGEGPCKQVNRGTYCLRLELCVHIEGVYTCIHICILHMYMHIMQLHVHAVAVCFYVPCSRPHV